MNISNSLIALVCAGGLFLGLVAGIIAVAPYIAFVVVLYVVAQMNNKDTEE